MATRIQSAQSLPISKSMPRVTAQHAHFLSLKARPSHVGFECDGPGHLSRAGPRHDNDHVNFQDIQILPTTDEILAVQRSPYMPKKNIEERSHLEAGPQRLLDNLFRHLRYDSIEGIRDVTYHAAQYLVNHTAALSDDPEPQQETPSGNRYFLYPNVQFEELLSDEKRGIIIRVSYSCPQFMRGRAMLRSGRLEEGMLCALACLGDDGKSLSVIFFEVFMTQSTDSMQSRGGKGVRAAVQLAFARPAKQADVQRVLRYAQGLSTGRHVLVEFPKLLYAGFYHCLSTLQQMKTTEIAFAQYIAPRITKLPAATTTNVTSSALTLVSPPQYSTAPGFRFNLGCLAKNNASFSLSQVLQKGGKDFMHFLKQSTTLDDGQASALSDCLTREVAFTQGPPGTGKTFLGVALSRVLLASRPKVNRKPILVVCLTNHALDSFLGGLVDAGITKVARIGRGSKEEWTKKFELRTLTRNTKMSQLAWEVKIMAVQDAQSLFTDIEAKCKGLNVEATTGSLSWPTVEAYLRTNQPEVYQQLTTSNDNPYTRSFAFDYWSGGGDLRNLRELRAELETCLLGTSANEGSSISSKGIDRALEQIAIHAQRQSVRAAQSNIWKCSLEERQQMLRSWKADIDREELVEHLATLQTDHQSAGEAIKKTWYKRDAKCLLEQDVIGLTTTACASNWEMLKTLDLEVVICEEAGEVMEAHTLCSLFPSVQHAIFIGDPQQLRPGVNEQKMSLETALGSQYRLDESLFERCMVPTDPKSKAMPTSHLNIQRRMHPDIADIPRLIYPFLTDHISTTLHPSTKGIAERMYWIDHRMPEADSSAASKSQSNPYEVAMITGMVQHLIKGNAYSVGDIAVLTPYNGQLAALHDSLKSSCSVWLSEKDRKALLDEGLLQEPDEDRPRAKDVVNMSNLLRVATIDNFQGEEAKIVILSTVRSGGRPGFLKTMNRINVACSRARDGFYIVGDSKTVGQVPMWRQIIDLFAIRNRIGSSLRICCPRHPDHHKDIATPQDFNLFQECEVPCGETLPCGHSCQEPCHAPELHERLPCMTPCEKVHPCGHRCLKLCSEACGTCQHPIQHHVLPCAHPVNILCSGGVPACEVLIVDDPLPCGHGHSYRCCDKGKPYFCDEKCGKPLPCGHFCQGLCADCRASITGSHPPCSSKCGAKFPNCGHDCDSECHSGSPCPSCKQPCEESCAHGSCKNVCSEDCNPCVKPHKTSCNHRPQSSLLCSLPSDVLPCNELCNRVLRCGHRCPSLCGEVCPDGYCPQCANGVPPAAAILNCPSCHCVLDISELDRRLISGNIYTIDQKSNITGFASKRSNGLTGETLRKMSGEQQLSTVRNTPQNFIATLSRDSQSLNCQCGSPLYNIHRYSILRQLTQAPHAFDLLLTKIGKSLHSFSRCVHYHEKTLEDSFTTFRNAMRPNPLAATYNKGLVSSRASELLKLSDSIQEYNTSTVAAFEKSVEWMQTVFPGILNHTKNDEVKGKTSFPIVHPIFSMRFDILDRRARNLWIYDCLRVSKYLVGLEDPSLEVQRMGEVLRVRASKECWKGIGECENFLKKVGQTAPAIEVEVRLQQVQLHHLLDIALAGDGGETAAEGPSPSMTPEPAIESLRKATQLCRRFPDSAGRSMGLVLAFSKLGPQKKKKEDTSQSLATLPRTNTYDSRRAELSWGEHVVGHLKVCERWGHPYCGVTATSGEQKATGSPERAGCIECGREKRVEVGVGMSEEGRQAGVRLFENQFLEAMKAKSRAK